MAGAAGTYAYDSRTGWPGNSTAGFYPIDTTGWVGAGSGPGSGHGWGWRPGGEARAAAPAVRLGLPPRR